MCNAKNHSQSKHNTENQDWKEQVIATNLNELIPKVYDNDVLLN